MSGKSKKYTPTEKAEIALEVIKSELTLAQISSKYGTHSTQINAWKKQAVALLADVFRDKGKPELAEYETQLVVLYRQIVRPGQVFSTDITYIRLKHGFVYLVAIIDWYSRFVLDWQLSITVETNFCIETLQRVLLTSRCDIFNTDRGGQYCSHDYQEMLKKYGLICSMSQKGNCWDNACAESFFHSLKIELIYTEKYATREIAKQSIFEYIEVYYNRVRRHSSIGSIAPMVFENQYKKVV